VVESNDGKSIISIERPDLMNLQDSESYTALHYAAINRQPILVAALLRWGADPYIQDRNGNTPLHLTAEGTNYTIDIFHTYFNLTSY
jgi:ankyrin repeat protein